MNDQPTLAFYLGQPVRVKKGHGQSIMRRGVIDIIDLDATPFIGVVAQTGHRYGFEPDDLEPVDSVQLPMWKDGE